jgi:hypothetical protein
MRRCRRDESVGVGGRVYSRSADDTGALAAEPWVVFPTTPPPSDEDLVDQLVGLVQVLVGETVVEVDTSLGDAELAAALASLQPFDLDAELARVAAEAEAMWNEGMPVG